MCVSGFNAEILPESIFDCKCRFLLVDEYRRAIEVDDGQLRIERVLRREKKDEGGVRERVKGGQWVSRDEGTGEVVSCVR